MNLRKPAKVTNIWCCRNCGEMNAGQEPLDRICDLCKEEEREKARAGSSL